MFMVADDFDQDRRRAEVFDALSHPTRILILKALSDEVLGFADLKKKLGIESSGHLQHHLNKLDGLVKTDEYGKYTLSDQGKDALLSVQTVERTAKLETKQNGKVHRSKKNVVLQSTVVALAILLIVSSTLAVVEYATLGSQTSSYQNKLSKQNAAITQLDTALNFSQAVLSIKQPSASQYLTTVPQSNSGGNPTKIFLLSTTIGYFYGPNPWPFNEKLRNTLMVPLNNGSISLPDFGWQYAPGNYTWSLMGGGPYLMIGITVRNDYTSADAVSGASSTSPIGNLRGVYLSYLSLTVKLYSQDDSIVQATNLNVTYAPDNPALGNQEFILESGATTQVIFYLSPASLNIDHYQVYVSYLSAPPQT
jgi:DNA-binding HxlR family transcriptional regulator